MKCHAGQYLAHDGSALCVALMRETNGTVAAAPPPSLPSPPPQQQQPLLQQQQRSGSACVWLADVMYDRDGSVLLLGGVHRWRASRLRRRDAGVSLALGGTPLQSAAATSYVRVQRTAPTGTAVEGESYPVHIAPHGRPVSDFDLFVVRVTAGALFDALEHANAADTTLRRVDVTLTLRLTLAAGEQERIIQVPLVIRDVATAAATPTMEADGDHSSLHTSFAHRITGVSLLVTCVLCTFRYFNCITYSRV